MRCWVLGIYLLSLACSANAGVVIGTTRVIVQESTPYTTVNMRMTGDISFLIIGRVLNTMARKTGDVSDKVEGFKVLPPAFVMKKGQERKMQITVDGNNLPQDRESMMYLMISSVPEGGEEKNSVQIAIRTWIKLFYRPTHLEGQSIPSLFVTLDDFGVVMKNDSPFYISLSGVHVGGVALDSPGEIAPFDKIHISGCSGKGREPCKVRWTQIGEDNRGKSFSVNLLQ